MRFIWTRVRSIGSSPVPLTSKNHTFKSFALDLGFAMPLRMPTVVGMRQRRHGKTWGIRWKPQWVDIETGRWGMWETRLLRLAQLPLEKKTYDLIARGFLLNDVL